MSLPLGLVRDWWPWGHGVLVAHLYPGLVAKIPSQAEQHHPRAVLVMEVVSWCLLQPGTPNKSGAHFCIITPQPCPAGGDAEQGQRSLSSAASRLLNKYGAESPEKFGDNSSKGQFWGVQIVTAKSAFTSASAGNCKHL